MRTRRWPIDGAVVGEGLKMLREGGDTRYNPVHRLGSFGMWLGSKLPTIPEEYQPFLRLLRPA